MKKITPLLASLPLITTACGGSGGGSTPPTGQAQDNNIDLTNLKGIWSDADTVTYTSPSGKNTTFQAPSGIVTSQEHMIVMTGNSELYVVEPNTNKAHFFTSFGFSTEITLETTAQNSNFRLSFYNPQREANGQLTLPADAHYDTPTDVSLLIGNWTDTYHPGTTKWTFSFDNSGNFTANKNIAGCLANGSMSEIDSTKQELAVTITFNSNCDQLDGTHTGLAWPSEENPNDELNIAVYNGFTINSKAMGWKITR